MLLDAQPKREYEVDGLDTMLDDLCNDYPGDDKPTKDEVLDLD